MAENEIERLTRLLGRLPGLGPRSARRAVLTNMHIDLDYQTLDDETPDHITPAYDGLTVSFELE